MKKKWGQILKTYMFQTERSHISERKRKRIVNNKNQTTDQKNDEKSYFNG